MGALPKFCGFDKKAMLITKILILNHIDDAAITHLNANCDVVFAFDAAQDSLVELVHDCEILIFRSGKKLTAEI